MNDSARAAPVAVTPRVDRQGLSAALAAYLIWGLFPFYMKFLQVVPFLQIMAHRIFWGFLFALGLLSARGELPKLRDALANPQTRWRLIATATLIAMNWTIFLWGIAQHRVVEVSLGYFMNPLVVVLLGVLVLSEKLNQVQWLSVAAAASGVAYLTWTAGHLPWISLALAISFGLYGLIRKLVQVEALPGFATETLFLMPFAGGYLLWCQLNGSGAMGHVGWGVNALLLISGPLTAIPLVLFAIGARRIPLSMMGILQYFSPTLQLLTAVLILGEPFGGTRVIGFVLIWAALIIYAGDGLWRSRRAPAG